MSPYKMLLSTEKNNKIFQHKKTTYTTNIKEAQFKKC